MSILVESLLFKQLKIVSTHTNEQKYQKNVREENNFMYYALWTSFVTAFSDFLDHILQCCK